MLKWLAFSIRPLYLEELAEAFILAKPFNQDERLFKPESVLTYLGGLVNQVPTRYSPRPDSVRFAQFSVKEYLCSKRSSGEKFITEEQALHLYLATSCLLYHLQASEIH